jgi:hypothetical protein
VLVMDVVYNDELVVPNRICILDAEAVTLSIPTSIHQTQPSKLKHMRRQANNITTITIYDT